MVALFVCLAIGCVGYAECQIYSNEALFYVEAGESLMSNPYLRVVCVDSETNMVFSSFTRVSYVEEEGFEKYDDNGYIRWCLRRGGTVYECKYNSRLSKNDKEIYEYYAYGHVMLYFVFSDDLSTMEVMRNDGSNKTTYIRVTRDKFKVKGSSNDYDFLYD